MQAEAKCGVDPLTEAEIKAIIKDEADDMDYKTTFEYLGDIVDEEAEFVQECTPVEKVMRLIRRAHLNGFGKALRLYNDTVKEAADYKGGPQERGKMYAWELPGLLIDRLHIGDEVLGHRSLLKWLSG